MKKVALTVAVLALGLAACNKNNADNNAATDTNVENAAAVDTNAAVANDATANADAALNARRTLPATKLPTRRTR